MHADEGAPVIQHIVLLKWKPETTEEQILSAVRRAEHLPNEIDGVESLTIGRNRVSHEHGYTHVLIVRLTDEPALARYLEHPLRNGTCASISRRSSRSGSSRRARRPRVARRARSATGSLARASEWAT